MTDQREAGQGADPDDPCYWWQREVDDQAAEIDRFKAELAEREMDKYVSHDLVQLKAEMERRQREWDGWDEQAQRMQQEIARLRTEVDTLGSLLDDTMAQKAEQAERLRALEDAANAVHKAWYLSCDIDDAVLRLRDVVLGRAALEESQPARLRAEELDRKALEDGHSYSCLNKPGGGLGMCVCGLNYRRAREAARTTTAQGEDGNG